jgi:hypothetical protein
MIPAREKLNAVLSRFREDQVGQSQDQPDGRRWIGYIDFNRGLGHRVTFLIDVDHPELERHFLAPIRHLGEHRQAGMRRGELSRCDHPEASKDERHHRPCLEMDGIADHHRSGERGLENTPFFWTTRHYFPPSPR